MGTFKSHPSIHSCPVRACLCPLFSGVFERAMENPRYLPLLALLHPPPSGRFLPGLTRYDIVQMMANDYPQHLRDGTSGYGYMSHLLTSPTEVHAAVEVDPERVIHVISLILFRRYSSDAPSNPSEEGSAVGLVAGPEDIVSKPLSRAIMEFLASNLVSSCREMLRLPTVFNRGSASSAHLSWM